MNTRQIEYIMEIAKHKNMQRAAEALYVSQSTLSQTLLKIEKDLNCLLFIRNCREMTLTKAGELYIKAGQEILNIEQRMEAQIKKLSKSYEHAYRVGISSHDGMELFLRASGRLQEVWNGVEIFAVENKFKQLSQMIQNDELDLAIVTWHSVDNLPVAARILSNEEICLIAPMNWNSDEYMIGDEIISWEALRNQKLILPNEGTTIRSMVDKTMKKLGIQQNIAFEITNIDSTKKLVSQGKGLGFLPRNLLRGELTFRVFSLSPSFHRYQMVIYRKDRDYDEVMESFISMLENEM